MAADARSANPCRAHGCAACCYETEMPITEEDARRLEARGHKREDFAEADGDGILTLRNIDNADPAGKRHCYFLRSDLCSVYEARPAGCRIYPFVLDASATRVVRDEDCPHRREFAQDAGAGRRLRVLWGAIGAEAAKRKR